LSVNLPEQLLRSKQKNNQKTYKRRPECGLKR
jgi:hypothetical protein